MALLRPFVMKITWSATQLPGAHEAGHHRVLLLRRVEVEAVVSGIGRGIQGVRKVEDSGCPACLNRRSGGSNPKRSTRLTTQLILPGWRPGVETRRQWRGGLRRALRGTQEHSGGPRGSDLIEQLDLPPATVDTDRLSVIGTTPGGWTRTVASIRPRTVALFGLDWGG